MKKSKFLIVAIGILVASSITAAKAQSVKWFYFDCECGNDFQEEVGKEVDRGMIYLSTQVFSVPTSDISDHFKGIGEQLKEALDGKYKNGGNCRWYGNSYKNSWGDGLIGSFDSEEDALRHRRAMQGDHNQNDHIVIDFDFKYY